MSTDLRFVQFKPKGKVHVYAGLFDLTSAAIGECSSPATVLMASQKAICGARGSCGQQFGVTVFDDNDICMKCYDAWSGDKADLFGQRESFA